MSDKADLRSKLFTLDLSIEKEKDTLGKHKSNRDALMETISNGAPKENYEDYVVNKDILIYRTGERLKALRKEHTEVIKDLSDQTDAEDPGPNEQLPEATDSASLLVLEGLDDAKSPRGKPWHVVPTETTECLCHTIVAASWTVETPAKLDRTDRCSKCQKELDKLLGDA